MHNTPGNRQIAGIDLLRFGAASMVMVYHLAFCAWASPASTPAVMGANPRSFVSFGHLCDFGWVGVEIFFVISGFVIAYSADGSPAASFAKSRFLRLAPGAWICSTISAAVLLATVGATSSTVRAYFGSMLLNPAHPWVDEAYWTLGVEMAFYAVIFGLLGLNLFRRAIVVFAALGLGSVAFWAAYFARSAIPPGIGRIVEHLATSRIGELALIQHGCFFALGGLLWLILRKRATAPRVGLAAACAGGCVLQILAKARLTEAYMGVPMNNVAPVAVWALAILAMVAAIKVNGRMPPALGRPARSLGLATYPLYLLHDVVGSAAMVALIAVAPPLVALALVGCGAVALSLVVERVEARLRSRTRRALDIADATLSRRLPRAYQSTDPIAV